MNIIFSGLCNGAGLYPLDLREEGLNRIGEWISQEGLTFYYSGPTVFRQFANSTPGDQKFPTVRIVALGGEKIDDRDIGHYKRLFSRDCIFVCRLTSTETSMYGIYFFDQDTQIEGSFTPGGFPIHDMEVALLDDDGKEAGPDGIGEIAVRSPFIALGYWELPELTQEVFLPDPDGGEKRIYLTGDVGQRLPDGNILHLGRKDHQVKIRGFRVEVAEIELALLTHEAITDTVVIARDKKGGGKDLVAYLVGEEKKLPNDHILRRFLGTTLPNYMVPSTYVRMDSLPKLPGGKIDRNGLPAAGRGRPDLKDPYANPLSVTEQVLADIWAQVLEIDFVGIHDDFLDLGGDSLLAAALLVHVEESFGKKLPLAVLIQASTVAQMAKVLSNEQWSSKSSLVPIQPKGDKPPFFCVHGRGGHVLGMTALARRLGEDQPFYGLESAGRDGEQQPLTRIEEMAAHYIKEIKTIQPDGPYLLGGYSMGGVIAFEMAQQLQAEGKGVALLAMLDSVYPRQIGPWKRRRDLVLSKIAHSPRLLQRNPTTRKWVIGEKIRQTIKRSNAVSPIEIVNGSASGMYKPRSYNGKINYFWARDGYKNRSDTRLLWRGLAERGIEIHKIPGDHESIFREPQLQVLASCLKDCLDQAMPS